MYIFQPDRILLEKQVKSYRKYIRGKCLDVGAGSLSRYQHLFNCERYIKMDPQEGENIDIVGKAEAIPFEDNSFDSVVCTQVLEHVKYPSRAAKEIYRILKKDGYCLITIPQVNELHEEPNDFFRYTNFGLIEIFKRQGFKLVEYNRRGGFFTMIAQQNIRYFIDRLDLYNKSFIGRIFSKIFKIYGLFMMWLDKVDNSKANKKHTLGWAFVFKKL